MWSEGNPNVIQQLPLKGKLSLLLTYAVKAYATSIITHCKTSGIVCYKCLVNYLLRNFAVCHKTCLHAVGHA